jgi:DNA repair photolyase
MDTLLTTRIRALLAKYAPQPEPPLVQIDLSQRVAVALAGCRFIYAPGGQAGEYAPLAANPYSGCGHKCAYCYVPKFVFMTREEFNSGAKPKADFLKHLRHEARKYQAAGIREQVMLSFSTDVYNPFDTSLTRPTIEILIEHGMGFCVLTKGGGRALADMDLYRADRDAFASTLTSLDDAFSLKWERGATLPGERIETLKTIHEKGIYTWVSLEPVLDTEASLKIVQETHEFVDFFKVGRANYLPLTKTTDWRSYTERMIELLSKLGVNNPMRAQQHH